MARRRHISGFTLIELMIVVAVLSVLALIALPKFSSLIRRANEAGSKGHLGATRAAIRLYYMDNDQIFPGNFAGLRQAGNKYLGGSIPLYTGEHPVIDVADDLPDVDTAADPGHWGYVSGGSDQGYFYIQCVHLDSTNRAWSSY